MRILRTGIILALFATLATAPGCGGAANSNTAKSNRPAAAIEPPEDPHVPKTNLEELRILINVPYEAEDVVWKEDAAHTKLIAVLRFLPADAAKAVAEAEKFGAPQAGVVSPESWFPDELTAQSEMSGDSALKGSVYPANGFLQEPYKTGKLTRIEGTDFFVLEVSK